MKNILIAALLCSGWTTYGQVGLPATPAPPPEIGTIEENPAPTIAPVPAVPDKAGRKSRKAPNATAPKLALGEEWNEADLNVTVAGDTETVMAFDHIMVPGSRGSSHPLVIRSTDQDANVASNLNEDLAVMSRILSKSIEHQKAREGREYALGIALSSSGASRRPTGMYLEGYGAVFLMNVRFPLLPPPPKSEEKGDKVADSTWEKTRQEMYGPRPGTLQVWDVASGPEKDTVEYDADQVDDLKRSLLDTMKNAANIRDVKPGEYITIAVSGLPSASGGPRTKRIISKGTGNLPKKTAAFSFAETGRVDARETTLTIRSKKSDVDELAKGKITPEEFRKRTTLVVY